MLIVLFMISGCHGRTVTPRYDIHRGPGYAYQRQNDGAVIVAAEDARALHKALGVLGCGTEFLCLVGRTGDIYQVLQRVK